jgi:multidrug efflux pump subunit AcrA (membrane-fusion protein)
VRLEASERLAATQLQMAELSLKRTEIRAPIDGVIVSEDADMNTFVTRGSGLLTIDDTSKVEVATSLRMDQLYWVLNQQGSDVNETSRNYDLPETPAIIEYELTGRDDEVYRWNGRLMSYDGIGLDAATRTVPVRVVVDDPTAFIDADGKVQKTNGSTPLVRGMFVRVKLLIRPKSQLVVIPATALQPGNRVFQFIPDESVLDVETGLDGQLQVQAVSSDAKEAVKIAELETPFDPERWDPGKVVVRKSVHPIDTLSIEAFQLVDPSSSAFASRKRLWVCEVRDADLTNDSFVVVSPVGTIDEDTFPVRAERIEQNEASGQVIDSDESAGGVVVTVGEDA